MFRRSFVAGVFFCCLCPQPHRTPAHRCLYEHRCVPVAPMQNGPWVTIKWKWGSHVNYWEKYIAQAFRERYQNTQNTKYQVLLYLFWYFYSCPLIAYYSYTCWRSAIVSGCHGRWLGGVGVETARGNFVGFRVCMRARQLRSKHFMYCTVAMILTQYCLF